MEDVPRLPTILRSTPAATICRLQKALARYYRALLWQQPHGEQYPGAYDLLQVSLCRRAKALSARMAASRAHPEAWLARHELVCPDSLQTARIRFS